MEKNAEKVKEEGDLKWGGMLDKMVKRTEQNVVFYNLTSSVIEFAIPSKLSYSLFLEPGSLKAQNKSQLIRF
jgi:hypothetical protein